MLTTRALQAPVKQPTVPSPLKPAPLGPVAGPPAASEGLPAEEASTIRTVSFYFGLAFLFVVFGVLPELVYYITGINTYLIYWVGPAAIFGALINGGLKRTFQNRAAWYWLAFFVWLVIGLPFSYWKGGSYNLIYDYARIAMPILFVVGGLARSWKEIRAVFYTIGMAGLVNLLSARIFAKEENGRLNMDASGTIGNSNDLAAHLIIVLPFLLFIAMDKRRNPLIRLAMVPMMGYGISVILGTASRGGLIALGAVFVFMILRATPKQRILSLIAAVVLGVMSFAILPGATLDRLGSLFGGKNEEAEESGESRSYLFWTSVDYTIQHPVFGVGLGQFANFEGKTRVAEGKVGNWHATHCSWTQVSSECGIPALLLFVLGIGSALRMVYRTWRMARAQKQTDIANACFCYLIAMVGFLVAITFLANAYRFYFPAMVGLAISMSFVANRQMSAKPAGDRRFAGIIPPQPVPVR